MSQGCLSKWAKNAQAPVVGFGMRRGMAYWWGHETIEDREKAIQAKEDAKIIQWRNPDGSLAKRPSISYAPLRVEKEKKALYEGIRSDLFYHFFLVKSREPGFLSFYLISF